MGHSFDLLLFVAFLVVSSAGMVDKPTIEPMPTTWPATFQIDFHEEAWYLVTVSTKGTMYYDAANNRSRVDRESGRGDRFCGSVYKLRHTACTHLVTDGVRYLYFPEHKFCCTCCRAEDGCGILKQDWLSDAQYLGQDLINGVRCNKWNKPGLQDNMYWETEDHCPLRIYMKPNEEMTFDPDSFEKKPLNGSLFNLPPWECEQHCGGLCRVSRSEGASSLQKVVPIRQGSRPQQVLMTDAVG